jgi:hypothetical protein
MMMLVLQERMDQDIIRRILSRTMSELGRKGGKARLTKMTARRRKEIAREGARASVLARKLKAKRNAADVSK